MDIIRDTFDGIAGEVITNHLPELGGPLVRNVARNTVDAFVTGANTAKGQYSGNAWANYTTRLPISAYTVQWSTRIPTSDQTDRLGVLLSDTPAFGQYLRCSIRPAHNDIQLDNNGTIATEPFFHVANQVDTWALQIVDEPGVGRQATLFRNAAPLIITTLTSTPDTPLLTIQWDGTTTPGNITEMFDLTALTLSNVPLIATAFLSTELGVFAQYTPATASELAALRFEYAARAIILKGSLADAAVVRLMYTTPPEYIFAP